MAITCGLHSALFEQNYFCPSASYGLPRVVGGQELDFSQLLVKRTEEKKRVLEEVFSYLVFLHFFVEEHEAFFVRLCFSRGASAPLTHVPRSQSNGLLLLLVSRTKGRNHVKQPQKSKFAYEVRHATYEILETSPFLEEKDVVNIKIPMIRIMGFKAVESIVRIQDKGLILWWGLSSHLYEDISLVQPLLTVSLVSGA
ncbi:uncharacterized protein EV154DRAFT_477221 [Mucor mucedo]|uniref:uncharacterized protein n=1 Tax=Mucor mucedo TaxID=29922 RepID=UPI002220224B|nr:uncharacterized protein EV154DRAFT_477221 [Mucor mucedo]KAI7895772.1 hypothetical protein EV154DRAFT_477221 [Mucor mucedo]